MFDEEWPAKADTWDEYYKNFMEIFSKYEE